MHAKVAPSLLVLMGSLDWLTTIVGIVFFGAVEGNPFLSNLTKANLPVFTVVKLGAAVVIGLLFYQAEKILNGTTEQASESLKRIRFLLKAAYATSLAFLMFAVLNNTWQML